MCCTESFVLLEKSPATVAGLKINAVSPVNFNYDQSEHKEYIPYSI